ncbi:MAG: hypothetical protein ACJ8AW_18405 [Rhodopila sp.]
MPTIIAHMQGVATAENVVVNPGLKRLLDKAGLQPPPPGQVLAIRHVNDQLAAANMTTDKRLDVKNALVRMRMVEIGKRVDVFR